MKRIAVFLCVLAFVLVSCGGSDTPPLADGTPLTVEVTSSAAHFSKSARYPEIRLFTDYGSLETFLRIESARFATDVDYRSALFNATRDLDEAWFEDHDLLQITLADSSGADFELTALYGFPGGKGVAQVSRIAPEKKGEERAVFLWIVLEKGVFTAASDLVVSVS